MTSTSRTSTSETSSSETSSSETSFSKTSFSKTLAQRTRASHSETEGAGFMAGLIEGRGSREDYIALSAQHWFIYQAIELAVEGLGTDPVLAQFHHRALVRLPAIEADLTELVGANWRDQLSPLPTTRAYVNRVNEVANWPGGVVAHHYTRYLGDLSGGQYIAKAMRSAYGLDTGLSFYDFSALGDLTEFKTNYRAALDSAPWDEDEQQKVLDEVLAAYRFNTDLFDDLSGATSTV